MNEEAIVKSQAKGDYTEASAGGGFFALPLLAYYGRSNFLLPHPLDLPPFWSPMLDNVYLLTLTAEKLWAQALGIATSKIASQSWEIKGPTSTTARETRALMAFGAKGMSRVVTDYLISCNGAWVEIVHETRSAGSRVLGLVPLDSRRVTRTGDLDIPATYRLLDGREVQYRAHQIAEITDMPDPSGSWLGVGHCAADRAYSTIRRMHMVDLIVDDKISDRKPNKLVAVKGISRGEVENAFKQGEAQTASRGVILYQGAYFLVGLGDDKPEFSEIALKDLPENFDVAEERKHAMNQYANAIGLDPLDLQEPRGGLGTGQQAEVLHEKAKGRGLGLFNAQWAQLMNGDVCSTRTTFAFNERDLRDELKREQVSKAKSDRVKVDIESGVLQPNQGLQVLVDEGVYPDEFLAQDVTDDATISGDENPDAVEAERNDADELNEVADEVEELPDEITLKEASVSVTRWALLERALQSVAADD